MIERGKNMDEKVYTLDEVIQLIKYVLQDAELGYTDYNIQEYIETHTQPIY